MEMRGHESWLFTSLYVAALRPHYSPLTVRLTRCAFCLGTGRPWDDAAIALLTAERVALNFMQRMSGIATYTRQMADAAKPALMLETRKTVPGCALASPTPTLT